MLWSVLWPCTTTLRENSWYPGRHQDTPTRLVQGSLHELLLGFGWHNPTTAAGVSKHSIHESWVFSAWQHYTGLCTRVALPQRILWSILIITKVGLTVIKRVFWDIFSTAATSILTEVKLLSLPKSVSREAGGVVKGSAANERPLHCCCITRCWYRLRKLFSSTQNNAVYSKSVSNQGKLRLFSVHLPHLYSAFKRAV